MFSSFTFSKHTFYLTALQDMLLPTNKASMLRGGFGNCFKKLVCANNISKICKKWCKIAANRSSAETKEALAKIKNFRLN